MFNLGAGELIAIFFLVLLLFGADKLPDIARKLGEFVGEFKKAGREFRNTIEDAASEGDRRDGRKGSEDHA